MPMNLLQTNKKSIKSKAKDAKRVWAAILIEVCTSD